MKLLLASDGKFLINKGYESLGIPKDKFRIGYITTASKGARNSDYIVEHKKLMNEHGYKFEELDIEGKSKEELLDFFKNKNVIHMEGGNTFYLLRAIKKSGFDEILKELLDNGLIYVGTSAGSSVAGPTIELSSHVPEGARPEELMAIDLVPFIVKAHYTPDKKEGYQKRLKNIKYPVRFLMDGQGILVNGDQYELIGQGEEVKI